MRVTPSHAMDLISFRSKIGIFLSFNILVPSSAARKWARIFLSKNTKSTIFAVKSGGFLDVNLGRDSLSTVGLSPIAQLQNSRVVPIQCATSELLIWAIIGPNMTASPPREKHVDQTIALKERNLGSVCESATWLGASRLKAGKTPLVRPQGAQIEPVSPCSGAARGRLVPFPVGHDDGPSVCLPLET